ncbi:MAG: AI-2E family transporter [Candidatus Marinimicrobia bacterium]|nr:AI-2E family transporter [Candidatus Neomarinimicrobiota bacterium]
MMTKNQKFIVKLLAYLAGIFVLFFLITKLTSLILIIVLSILLFTMLDPSVDKLERYNIPRSLSTAIVILLVFLFIGIGVSGLAPIIQDAGATILEKIKTNDPNDNNIENIILSFDKNIPFYDLSENMPEILEKLNPILSSAKSKLAKTALNIGKSIINLAANLFVIIFITFFFLKDERQLKKGLIKLIPNKHFELSLNLMYKIQKQLASYLKGQFLAATSVGVLSTFGLFILNTFFDANIPYFILIGILAGLANLIPYVGPAVGIVFAITPVIFMGPENMLFIIVLIIITFSLVQMIDNVLVSPIVVGKSVDMHPLAVFIVLIIGGSLLGMVGMLFAVPAAGIIKVTISEIITNASKYRD